MDNMDWHSVAVEGRRKLSGDAPFQLNKARIERSVLFGKVARTGDTWEKQLDAELPWTAIDPQDRPELKVEDKQWKEHIQFSAVRILREQATAEVRKTFPPEAGPESQASQTQFRRDAVGHHLPCQCRRSVFLSVLSGTDKC